MARVTAPDPSLLVPIDGRIVRTSLIKIIFLILLFALLFCGSLLFAVHSWREGKLNPTTIKLVAAGVVCLGVAGYFIGVLAGKKSCLIFGADTLQEQLGDQVCATIPYANIADLSLQRTDQYLHWKVIAIRLRDPLDRGTFISPDRPAWCIAVQNTCGCHFVIGGGYSKSLKSLLRMLEIAREIY